MDNFQEMVNKIHNIDCVEGMKKLPDGCIDLLITSPPYNVGIDYDTHMDSEPMDEYLQWCKVWLSEVFRVLKDDGRVAINIPYEVNVQARGGRVFILSEYWQIMKQIGYSFFGVVDLEEDSPHRSKTTAWGSWMSPSAPYIYNPKEAVILAYKKSHIKKEKGTPEWSFTEVEVVDEKGENKIKKVYSDDDKKEFMNLVFGQWKYFADTSSLTKATFSKDIPEKAIKILSFKENIVMDCFSGSGTTCLTAKRLGRQFIGFELSPNYAEISIKRINDYEMVEDVSK